MKEKEYKVELIGGIIMKKNIIFLFILAAFTASLGAQTVHDPNNQLYKDIDRWVVQGYVNDFLPMIRPYPIKLIEKILDEVIEKGNNAEQETAERYRSILITNSKILNPGISASVQGNEDDYHIIISPYVEGLLSVKNLFSVSFNFTVNALSQGLDGEMYNIPGKTSQFPDLVNDTANIGSYKVLNNWTNLVAIGSDSLYFQAGLSRTSFGPFFDNGIIVGPQAPRAGHFSLVYWDPLWSFEVLFQTLIATDDYGLGRFAGKYSVIHALNFRPFKNLELGAVQTIIYGERFDPLYLVPFSFLFQTQTANSGYLDNALIGLNFRWRAINSFLVKGQVYIDDFSFNGLLQGKPDFKASGIIGVSWSPLSGILSKLDFDYTAVMPYMYTHWHEPWEGRYNGLSGEESRSRPNGINPEFPARRIPNFTNYTHWGRNLGPDLEPNSDRFSLRSNWKIIRNLELNFSAYLTRHGNASYGKDRLAGPWNGESDEYHDGSIHDSGCSDPWLGEDIHPISDAQHNPYKEMNFLTQSIIDTRLGGIIGLAWSIPTPIGTFKLIADYCVQYGWDRDLISKNNGINHYWSIGGMWNL